MQATIQKWGKSLALRIPQEVAREAKLRSGSKVRLTIKDGRIIMTPIAQAISLKLLVSKITPENIHPETDWGPAQGKEIW